jgi:sugar phosphate isomerase/epimerase
MPSHPIHRRTLLRLTAGGLASLTAGGPTVSPADQPKPAGKGAPTRFQVACMTLPYAQFPLGRALTGIRSAGYSYVAWGTAHLEDGKRVPVVAGDAPPEQARELGKKCRDLGLEPVLMFGPSPDAVPPLTHRIRQAAAAGVGQVLTFGSSRGSDPKLWVKNIKEFGPFARDQGVLVVIKQHGGNTGTGAGLAAIVGEAGEPAVKLNYDAGNVADYSHGRVNPLEDVKTCVGEVRSFCIKDHRFYPKDQDCGPGLGEIDHYRLLGPFAATGLTMPLCCENIFAPAVPVPAKPEGIDALARRAREFLELVIQGIQTG